MEHTWYIGFSKERLNKYWYEVFCKNRTHVYMFRSCGDDWLLIDPTIYGYVIEVVNKKDMAKVINEGNKSNHDFLKVKSKFWKVKTFPLIPNYCISFVRRTLGLDALAITPDGLYNILIKHGAEVIKFGEDNGVGKA